jgi:hypothetical protein
VLELGVAHVHGGSLEALEVEASITDKLREFSFV